MHAVTCPLWPHHWGCVLILNCLFFFLGGGVDQTKAIALKTGYCGHNCCTHINQNIKCDWVMKTETMSHYLAAENKGAFTPKNFSRFLTLVFKLKSGRKELPEISGRLLTSLVHLKTWVAKAHRTVCHLYLLTFVINDLRLTFDRIGYLEYCSWSLCCQ